MKESWKRAILILVTLLFAANNAKASITINWGSPVDSILRDSYGNTLGAGMHFQLGSFAESFVPTFENIDLWRTHWRVFDEASYNPDFGYFTGTAEISSNGFSNSPDATGSSGTFNFLGLDAYLWVFNDNVPELWSTQWALVRADEWTFPIAAEDCCGSVLPLEWSLSDLSEVGTPVFGRTGDREGAGTSYAENPSYNLQTYSLVPEISSVPAIAAVALLVVCHRERRHKGIKDSSNFVIPIVYRFS